MVATSPGFLVGSHDRVQFAFTDGGRDLLFDYQRTFEHLLFDEGRAIFPSPISHIAPDRFDPKFDQGCCGRANQDYERQE
ncbi:hypothetical protein [Glutamicibacter sp. BW80]|uniref:hypothetical protein n=1 Tax=Glutamicibacter sp. BW80 TaxID=2024404 RepID=UPI0011427DA2|nr:hypothetical protein [Glutamicibacter sp. BW80]